MKIWILLTDDRDIRILELVEPNQEPREIDVRAQLEAIRLDRIRRRLPSDSDRKVIDFRSTERNIADFLATVSHCLETARQGKRFDRLVVAAPREMLGVLEANLTPEVRELLILELEGNLLRAESAVIRACLPI